ncbi:FHA domain-containing protein [Candidatus Woesearchaeota archaeon]|nr:FHA domain-containing protein [Candidatus Woesearchaeota archaeon]
MPTVNFLDELVTKALQPGAKRIVLENGIGEEILLGVETDGEMYYLEQMTIGRSPRKSLYCIPNTLLDDVHAVVEYDEQGAQWIVTDNRTQNGTFHNSDRTNQFSAEIGDTVGFGGAQLRYSLMAQEDPFFGVPGITSENGRIYYIEEVGDKILRNQIQQMKYLDNALFSLPRLDTVLSNPQVQALLLRASRNGSVYVSLSGGAREAEIAGFHGEKVLLKFGFGTPNSAGYYSTQLFMGAQALGRFMKQYMTLSDGLNIPDTSAKAHELQEREENAATDALNALFSLYQAHFNLVEQFGQSAQASIDSDTFRADAPKYHARLVEFADKKQEIQARVNFFATLWNNYLLFDLEEEGDSQINLVEILGIQKAYNELYNEFSSSRGDMLTPDQYVSAVAHALDGRYCTTAYESGANNGQMVADILICANELLPGLSVNQYPIAKTAHIR